MNTKLGGIRMKRRAVVGTIVGAVVSVSLFGQVAGAQGVTIDNRNVRTFKAAQLDGEAASVALHLGLADTNLTIAQTAGKLGFSSEQEVLEAPVMANDVAGALLVACTDSDALQVSGTSKCVRLSELQSRGVTVAAGATQIGLAELIAAGLVTMQSVSESQKTGGQEAVSTVSGVLIPNISSATAECNAANPTAEQVTVPIPAPVSSVIAGNLAFIRCSTVQTGLPSLVQETGEAVLDVTLTQTLVSNIPQLNSAIDSLQSGLAPLPEAVRTPVDNTLEELQERINAQPVVKVRVAPNAGELKGTATGVTATSVARGATIDILPLQDMPIGQLDGIAQITVGEANASASVVDGVAEASNGAAVIRVKVLNILTPDPDDVLLDLPVSPGTDPVTILENTPLQSTITVAYAPEPEKSCTDSGGVVSCTARAAAQSLTISIFDPVLKNGQPNSLPNIKLELASASVGTAGQFQAGTVAPRLPVTGAGSLPVMLAGLGLVTVAVLVRRRLVA